ncbi:MAG: shikimate kinase [Steroidobacteraceae bacterium]
MLGKPNIYLVGPMGTGKTAVGKQLARLLKVPFHDSDAEIERRAGVDIPYIFEQEGEAGFRERERETLAALVTQEPIVLATGGGAVLNPANRQLLAATGVVVFLDTSVSQQLQRVGSGRGRPLLKGLVTPARLHELRVVRDPLYREIADITLSTDNRRVARVAEMILRQLGREPAG